MPVAVTDATTAATPITAYTAISTLKDSVRPSVSAVTYTVNNSAHIAFSEPINVLNAAAVKLGDGGTIRRKLILWLMIQRART